MLTNLSRHLRAIGPQFELVDIFRITPQELKKRIFSRPGRSEIIALVFSVFLLLGLVFIQCIGNYNTYYDLQNFLNTGRGDFNHYYYAYWAVPAFTLLANLHFPYEFIIVGLINVLFVWFAVRIFGGKLAPLLISLNMVYILSQGQIVGIIVGGYALFVVGLVCRHWYFAGVGTMIALTKFQMAFIPILALLLLWDASWREKLKVLLFPLIILAISFLVYPGWPVQLVNIIQNSPPNDSGSISLWQWIGPAALILWIPPVVFRMPRQDRFWLMVIACSLSLPYFQQTDLLLLYSAFLGYGASIANLPFLLTTLNLFPQMLPWAIIKLLVMIPLGIYLTILLSTVKKDRLS